MPRRAHTLCEHIRVSLTARTQDYGSNAAGYVDASMDAIRWDNVAMLFDRYSRET